MFLEKKLLSLTTVEIYIQHTDMGYNLKKKKNNNNNLVAVGQESRSSRLNKFIHET